MIFACRNFSWLCKNLCFCKTSLIKDKKNFCGKIHWCRKLSWSSKIVFTVENIFVSGKFPWPSKIFLCKKFLDCGKISWLWKIPLIMEIFLDYGRNVLTLKNLFSWLHKIDLIILKTNANVETIKTYILNLEEKLSSLTFFAVDKINIICSRRFKDKY